MMEPDHKTIAEFTKLAKEAEEVKDKPMPLPVDMTKEADDEIAGTTTDWVHPCQDKTEADVDCEHCIYYFCPQYDCVRDIREARNRGFRHETDR